MSWSEFLTGAVTGGLLANLGYWTGQWRERRRTPKAPRPVCGCEHHFAQHDLRSGECHDTVDGTPIKYSPGGTYVIARTQVQCTCRHYTGPIPAELEFRPPPVMPREDT